jgi:hypothetical protein
MGIRVDTPVVLGVLKVPERCAPATMVVSLVLLTGHLMLFNVT